MILPFSRPLSGVPPKAAPKKPPDGCGIQQHAKAALPKAKCRKLKGKMCPILSKKLRKNGSRPGLKLRVPCLLLPLTLRATTASRTKGAIRKYRCSRRPFLPKNGTHIPGSNIRHPNPLQAPRQTFRKRLPSFRNGRHHVLRRRPHRKMHLHRQPQLCSRHSRRDPFPLDQKCRPQFRRDPLRKRADVSRKSRLTLQFFQVEIPRCRSSQ